MTNPDSLEAPRGLETPVQFLKGVGERRAEQLAQQGLVTVEDLLYLVPNRYEDRRTIETSDTLDSGAYASLEGTVRSVDWVHSRYGKPYVEVVCQDRGGLFLCRWFSARFLLDVLQSGQVLLIYGKIRKRKGQTVLQHPDYEILAQPGGEPEAPETGLLPVYPAGESLTQKFLRSIVAHALDGFLHEVEDILDADLLKSLEYPSTQEALRNLHEPDTIPAAENARSRLAFEEFLCLQLVLVGRRNQNAKSIKPHRNDGEGRLKRELVSTLPFTLTGAQERVLEDIERDLRSRHPMHRLLQGDVGSGKTLVAACAALDVIESGHQAVFMAPTEILARQHFLNLSELMKDMDVELALLTGDVKAAARRELFAGLRTGRISLLVGTHAVIEDQVEFRQLGLAVIDEQHKFGVAQRGSLYTKSQHPDVLVMTATPIPRTLAMTLYGDLDVSIMDELPGGRKPIVTRLIPEGKLTDAYGFIRDQVQKGRQAYLVYPLVSEKETSELKAATQMHEALSQTVFKTIRSGLLHGQMPAPEKERVMQQFRKGTLDVLVATTVIEVGVDVPNATVMLIEHADRFGLAQLHQLRGRIGRGGHKSYCILQGEPKSKDAWRRLKVMEETTDGFRIAEEDLNIRGMGNIMGAEQSGLPRFRVGNVIRDARLLQRARTTAEDLLRADPALTEERHQRLRQRAREVYRQTAGFVKVG